MSAAEEDTELRDLLIQNLENNGVLNKIKAELRAAVFLALEQQDKIENTPPLVNESLKKFLNTKDGRLVTNLVIDFLQVFNLDFTLAVFQPEINTLNGLENREAAAREIGITELDRHKGAPLLLELLKRSRQKEKPCVSAEDLTPRHIAEARRKFDFYDKDKHGEISQEELKTMLSDLCPGFHKSVLEKFVAEEFRAFSREFTNSMNFQEFLGLYRRWFHQCRSVVCGDGTDATPTPSRLHEDKTSSCSASKVLEVSQSDSNVTCDPLKNKIPPVLSSWDPKPDDVTPLERRGLDLGVEDDEDEGDSFFDDPLPKPQKTYGCGKFSIADKSNTGTNFSEKKNSHKDLSAINGDTEDNVGDALLACADGSQRSPEPDSRRIDGGKPAGSPPGSVSDRAAVKSSASAGVLPRDALDRHNDEDDDYDDDFNSTSHRSDNSKSELSIGEEIDEVSIEGPDGSDKLSGLEDITQDCTMSQLSHTADYMEDVS